MTTPLVVRFKVLLQERHWQTHRTFTAEYDKAARLVDPSLVGHGPSRAQLHRWTNGEIKGLPFPDACRVLEKMFPEWTAEQLFERIPWDQGDRPKSDIDGPQAVQPSTATQLLSAIDERLTSPRGDVEWRAPAPAYALVAPAQLDSVEDATEEARTLGHRLLELQQALRLTDEETAQFANLAGNVVELSMSADIDIDPDGWSRVTYRHHLLNLCDKPMSRLAREVWFENTEAKLRIVPISDPDHRVMIQRVHDTANLSKFACQISPPIQPGESATVGFTCEGGQFLEDHYWRQSVHRYLRHYSLRIRHQGAGQLLRCWATEEEPNGSENSAEDDLVWDYEGDDVVMTLTRTHLRPNQALTLRWDVPHEPA
ncbi:hypothetical protein SMC26_17865 [Actinomadura fulvescens]|uniref:XRE family transcriptional regulator n=1 Tax=Actinomadura fulvescens TaxID=46160 RepID=A0ABN3PYJ8_9ACTN